MLIGGAKKRRKMIANVPLFATFAREVSLVKKRVKERLAKDNQPTMSTLTFSVPGFHSQVLHEAHGSSAVRTSSLRLASNNPLTAQFFCRSGA